MIPAKLLIQIPNILRIGLHDTVTHIVSLAMLLILLSHRQNMAPLIRAVGDLFPTLPGKGENGFPVSVDPHVCDLFLNVSDENLYMRKLPLHIPLSVIAAGVP